LKRTDLRNSFCTTSLKHTVESPPDDAWLRKPERLDLASTVLVHNTSYRSKSDLETEYSNKGMVVCSVDDSRENQSGKAQQADSESFRPLCGGARAGKP